LLSHTQLFQLIPLFGGVDPAGPLVGVSSPKLNFTKQTHPKEQLLFAGPRPILIANTSIWWSRPCGAGVGVSPPKIKFSKQTHCKEQLLFAGPRPIINPSGNFRRGHCAGYPWGLTFWVAPWLYKLFHKHYIIKFINIIEKFINPIVMPQKHDNYTRKVLYGIGDGGGGWGL
jgi:hypothetical protein